MASFTAGVNSLPPPRLFFTISHYKEQTEEGQQKTFIGYYCRLEITYPKEAKKPDLSHIVLRRWSHFALFDQEWSKIFTSVFNKTKLADSRKLILQQYIQKLLTISCLQEFVAQFMELDYSLFKSADSTPINIAAALSLPIGGRDGAVSPAPAESPSAAVGSSGIRILNNSTYVTEGPEQKGNTDKASRKAHKMKAKFLEENKELLDQILNAKAKGGVPSIKLNLPFVANNNNSLGAPGGGLVSPEGSRSASPMPMPVRAASPLVGSASPMGSPLGASPMLAASPPPISRLPPPASSSSSVSPPSANGGGATGRLGIPSAFGGGGSGAPTSPPPPLPQRGSFNVGGGGTSTSPPVGNTSTTTPPPVPGKLKASGGPPPPLNIPKGPGNNFTNNANIPTSPVSAGPPGPMTQRPKKRDWGSIVLSPTAAGGLLGSPTNTTTNATPSGPTVTSPPPISSLPPRPSLMGGQGAPPPLPSAASPRPSLIQTASSSTSPSAPPPPPPAPKLAPPPPSLLVSPPPPSGGPPALPTSKPNATVSANFGKKPFGVVVKSPNVAAAAAAWIKQPGASNIMAPPTVPKPSATTQQRCCSSCKETIVNLNAKFCHQCGMPLNK